MMDIINLVIENFIRICLRVKTGASSHLFLWLEMLNTRYRVPAASRITQRPHFLKMLRPREEGGGERQ